MIQIDNKKCSYSFLILYISMYITKIVSVSTAIENYLLLKFNFLCCTSLIFKIALGLEDSVCLFIKFQRSVKVYHMFLYISNSRYKILGTDF